MILMIDNYDSFTYNLVQYAWELNADLQVHRNDKITLEQIGKLSPHGIMISPGPGRPENAGITVALIKEFKGQIPILGVCLGHQAIGYAFGGKVIRSTEIFHGKVSSIHHDQKDIFRNIASPFTATRYHSLIVDRKNFPEDELEVSAHTENELIMGLRHRHFPIYGVQFHPESILTEHGHTMIKNFLDICESRVKV